jgi:hypothetical protein
LGEAEKAERVEILWPSGLKESFDNVRANQEVVIVETRGITKTVPFQNTRKEIK